MVDRHVDIGTPQGSDLWSNIWQPFRQVGQQVAHLIAPSSEATGEDKQYTVNVELPGVKQADIDISLRDDMLVITGEKRDERKEEGENYFFSERSYGSFRRAFRIPQDVDQEAIGADFEDGVLTVSLPRSDKSAAQERKIEIG
jgi:HSP20 family protein